MKRYDIRDVAKRIVTAFLRFKLDNKLEISDEESFGLLSYSIKDRYGLECQEYSDIICEYGYYCSLHLRNTKGIPRKLNIEDATKLLDLVRAYFILKSI